LILYSHNITPRLQYAADFIAKELQVDSFSITSSEEEFRDYPGPRINYSDKQISAAEAWIKPYGLLFETGIGEQNTGCFHANGYKAFFKTGGDLPFDIFSACFYLLSRYEEYLPHTKDMYGRYAHENSLAYKEKFLNQPLINVWLQDFKKLLQQKFPQFIVIAIRQVAEKQHDSKFLPTYDIDIAWSYKHKGGWRNAGGFIRSLVKGQWSLLKERAMVLLGKQKDPFDAYEWLNKLHEQYKLKPYYFFLIPEKRGRYDKNIPPSSEAMQVFIHDHIARYSVGIHPSWKSGDDDSLLKKEIETLSLFSGNPVVSSRQHYIRFNLPGGYRRLIGNGIKHDFSMGYGNINGFRASVASPFYWYDLENEKQTALMLFPFCYMEANSFYEQNSTAKQALEEMRYYYWTVKSVNGHFIMIWHNSFLGTDKASKGWRDIYEQFIKETRV
jgi:hypothetical protein